MKLSETHELALVLREISQASQLMPKEFPVLVKLALAENMRLSMPHALEYETHKNELHHQFQKDHPAVPPTPGEKPTAPDPLALKAHEDELKALADAPVNTQFRRIYESELKESPITIGQMAVLQQCGILVKSETPKPPEAPK